MKDCSWAGITRTVCLLIGVVVVQLVVGCSDSSDPSQLPKQKAARAIDPVRLFRVRCATCHQMDGKGVATFPPLAGSSWVQGDEKRPIRIVLHGLQGKIRVDGKEYNGVMPGLGKQLSDEEIAAVLTYIRSSWGNSAPAITAETVRAVRESEGARSSLWTEAELLRD
jgi:mono/diheme cytochrome c family protein